MMISHEWFDTLTIPFVLQSFGLLFDASVEMYYI